jgi:hypothetical protein
MRLVGAIIAFLILSLACTASAQAQLTITRTGGLNFVGEPTVTVNKEVDENGFVTSASLTCAGEVTGAGTTATATCSATANVTQGCVNRGGNEPSGLQQTTQTVTGSDTFNTRQGRGTFSVDTDEVTTTITCPSRNMQAVLLSVEFTNITVSVTSQTGTVTATGFGTLDP